MVTVKVSDEFARQAKRFAKKYKSFVDDYAKLLLSIKKNPYQGTDLGNGKRKIRMAVAAKGKGKSGGMRVITYNISETSPGNVLVYFVTIYDKQEMANVSDKYVNQIIENLE